MKKYISLLFIFVSFVITGCQEQTKIEPIYIWNNYENTSIEYLQNGHEKEILEKHLLELKKIVNDSEIKKQRVAPGLYAELAQVLYETNKKEDAKTYFLLEKQTYPESTIFIDRILEKLYGENK